MRGFYFVKDKVEKYPNAELPRYKTSHSAGADFFAAEDTVIPSMHYPKQGTTDFPLPVLVHTGIKAKFPANETLLLFNRSSNPKRGLVLANGVGVVDSDYFGSDSNDGEIMFAFYNFSGTDCVIHAGESIGQGVFVPFLLADENAVFDDAKRTGGFGSTGI